MRCMPTTLFVILLMPVLAACAPAAPEPLPTLPAATSTPTPPPATVEPTAPPSPTPGACAASMDFQTWHTWTRVNDQPIQGHELWVTVYLNDLAKEGYLSATFPLQECAAIVKAHHAAQDSEDISNLTVMVKMPAGYDPEHGDWWYAMYDPTGRQAEFEGRVEVCIACHQAAADRDYLFAREVLEASGK